MTPPGRTTAAAGVDEWLREVAPSTPLRQWFGHDPARWAEFRRRYGAELQAEPATTAVARLRVLAGQVRVTLLYAAQDETRNNARVLLEILLAEG